MVEAQETREAKVRLYSLSTCPRCARIKRFLKANNVDCEIIDVDTLDSGEQWARSKELKQYNPKATYPTLVVERVMIDFDEETIREALGLK